MARKRKNLVIVLALLLLAIYLSGPIVAGFLGIGNRAGPKLYPEILHEPLYRIGWMCGPHVGKPRLPAVFRSEYRPWLYGMYSQNDDPAWLSAEYGKLLERQWRTERERDAGTHLNRSHDTLSVRSGPMTEDRFWELLGLLNWKKLGDDDAVVRPLVKALAKLPDEDIFAFDDRLAAKLHALDTEAHARNIGEGSYTGTDRHFSVDGFLYARCAVVVNGRQVFEQVLRDPSAFPHDVEFEAILYVADAAYEQKTDKEYPHIPAPDYETFSNQAGWPVRRR